MYLIGCIMRVSILKETKEKWYEDIKEISSSCSGRSDGAFPRSLRYFQEEGNCEGI